MINDNRIRALARQDGVTAGLAEKNYVNSWLLYAIYQNSELGNNEEITEALQQKAEQQNVELDLQNGIPQEDIKDVHNYWDQALDRLVTDKPPFKNVIKAINEKLQQLAQQHRER